MKPDPSNPDQSNPSDIIQNLVKEKLNIAASVFLSSTKEDLVEQRKAVFDLIAAMGLSPVGMETFGARTEPPLETCLNNLRKSQIYLGILGMRYGSVYQNPDNPMDEKNGLSYTEIEYNEAYHLSQVRKMSILIYCIDPKNAYIHPVDYDIENREKLERFKEKITQRHTIVMYRDLSGLLRDIMRDLTRHVEQMVPNNSFVEANHCVTSKNPRSGKEPDGQITISMQGDGSYYLGDTIKFSGISTCSETPFIYLYVRSAQKHEAYVPLNNLPTPDDTHTSKNRKPATIGIPVLKDYTWLYTWDLSKWVDRLDTGQYLIVAVNKPLARGMLEIPEDMVSCKASLYLKQPYLACIPSSTKFIQGLPYYIQGTVITQRKFLTLWVCSQTKFIQQLQIPINNDQTYFYDLTDLNKVLQNGKQYFGIIQMPISREYGEVRYFQGHPSFIARVDETGKPDPSTQILLDDHGSTNDIVQKICSLMDSTQGKDLYVRITFTFEKPNIECGRIELNPGINTITGTTNLPAGTKLFLELNPTQKTPSVQSVLANRMRPQQTGYATVISVVPGSDTNVWSTTINMNSLSKGEYTLRITLNSTAQELAVYTINI